MTEKKPKRRTRERVIATSLALFNEFGEPNVTTTTIAAELNISPGNLYYHFRNKDAIVGEIFRAFEAEIEPLLVAPGARPAGVEDIWLFLHLLFETIWKYRFLYRDLSELLSRNRTLETSFKRLLAEQARTTRTICDGLIANGHMNGEPHELDALATNATVVSTYWLSFAFARNPRHFVESEVVAEGAFQVMALFEPLLEGEARALFRRLAAEYRAH
jgi:AcrR family transcriptional regulator